MHGNTSSSKSDQSNSNTLSAANPTHAMEFMSKQSSNSRSVIQEDEKGEDEDDEYNVPKQKKSLLYYKLDSRLIKDDNKGTPSKIEKEPPPSDDDGLKTDEDYHLIKTETQILLYKTAKAQIVLPNSANNPDLDISANE